MSRYIYSERRTLRKQMFMAGLMLLATTFILTFTLTFVVVSKASSERIKELESKVDELNVKEVYYKQIEEQFFKLKADAFVNERYEQQLTEKEQQIGALATYNEDLIKQGAELENTIKKFAATGVEPLNFRLPTPVSRGSYDTYRDKLTYVGDWVGTYYAPNEEECSNNKGITASGEPIEPGRTIAVDPVYWALGTKFYIEGIGEVVAADTGSAIKGRNRFDYAVFDTAISDSGSFTARVFLIEE